MEIIIIVIYFLIGLGYAFEYWCECEGENSILLKFYISTISILIWPAAIGILLYEYYNRTVTK